MKSKTKTFYISKYHCISWILILFCICQNTSAQVPQAARDALVSLYNSTDGLNWENNNNWLTGDPCLDLWFGISCNAQDRVEEIILVDNNLVGTLPSNLTDIIQLLNLQITNNSINGTIPTEYGNFSVLQQLQLYDNQLSGIIPVELGNVSTFVNIDLHSNHLEGSIPIGFGSLFNLEKLSLYANKLAGDFPIEIISLLPSNRTTQENFLGAPLITLEIKYNSLDSNNSTVINALDDSCNCDWRSFQTLSPNNINVIASSSDSMSANWDPISYQRYGSYLVYVATDELGPYTLAYETLSKTETAYTAGNLISNQDYYFKIRTKTFVSHDNKNEVISLESEAVPNFTDQTVGNAEFLTKIKVPVIRVNLTANYKLKVENLGPDSVLGANFRHFFSTGFANGTWQCIESLGGAVCPSINIVNGNIDLVIDLPAASSLEFNLESDVVSQNQDFIIDDGSFIITATITPPEDISENNVDNNSTSFDLNKIFSNGFETD